MERTAFGEKDIILIGAGGHAKVVIEAIRNYKNNCNIIGICDKEPSRTGEDVLGVPIIGTDSLLPELYKKGLGKAFITVGTVGNPYPRINLYNYLKSMGYQLINVVHGSAVISESAVMGEGNVILAGAIINSGVSIGNNCICNSGCIIEHDCSIGDNVHIAPGVRIAGDVQIGNNSMIGIGATLIQGLKVGVGSLIGAGSVVTRDVPPDTMVLGVPARKVEKR